jgi:hypothetical protein
MPRPRAENEESVMAIEKGQTRYDRQTFLYYRVQIATFVANRKFASKSAISMRRREVGLA